MTIERFGKIMSYSVTSLFTFFLKDRVAAVDMERYYLDSYSFYNGKDDENYVYHLFTNHAESDAFVSKYYSNAEDVMYTDQYIIVKVSKWNYMSGDEWELLKSSKYDLFKELIYIESLSNNGQNLQYAVIHKKEKVVEYLSKYLEEDMTDKNIYWKAFLRERETLNLSKLTNMKELVYKEQWLLDEIEKAPAYERIVYEKVLSNSYALPTPKVTALQVKPVYDYVALFDRIKKHMLDLTGKTQYRVEIKGKKYSLIPNELDFIKRLKKVVNSYQLTDMDKVEQCILNHLNELSAPLLKYYIEKDGSSSLAEDYEHFTQPEPVKKETPNRKQLFG